MAAWIAARRVGLLTGAGVALALLGFVHPTRFGFFSMRLGSQEATRLQGTEGLLAAAAIWLGVTGPLLALCAWAARRPRLGVAPTLGGGAAIAALLADRLLWLGPWNYGSFRAVSPGPGLWMLLTGNLACLLAALVGPRAMAESVGRSARRRWSVALPALAVAWCAAVRPDPIGDGFVGLARVAIGIRPPGWERIVAWVHGYGWNTGEPDVRGEVIQALVDTPDPAGPEALLRLHSPMGQYSDESLVATLAARGFRPEHLAELADPGWARAALRLAPHLEAGAPGRGRALYARALTRHGAGVADSVLHDGARPSRAQATFAADLPGLLSLIERARVTSPAPYPETDGRQLAPYAWGDLLALLEDARPIVRAMAWGALKEKWGGALGGGDPADRALMGPPEPGPSSWTVSNGIVTRSGRGTGHSRSGLSFSEIGRPGFAPEASIEAREAQLPAVRAWVLEAAGLDGPEGPARRRALARRLVLEAADDAAADLAMRLVLRFPRWFYGSDLSALLDLAVAVESRAPSLRELHWAAGLSAYPTADLLPRLDDPRVAVRRLCWHALLWRRHRAGRRGDIDDYIENPDAYDPVTGDPDRRITLTPDPARPRFDPEADGATRSALLPAVREWAGTGGW